MTKRRQIFTLSLAIALLCSGNIVFAMGATNRGSGKYDKPYSNGTDRALLLKQLIDFDASLARLEEEGGLSRHGAMNDRRHGYRWHWTDTKGALALKERVKTPWIGPCNGDQKRANDALSDSINALKKRFIIGTREEISLEVNARIEACKRESTRVRQLLFTVYSDGQEAYRAIHPQTVAAAGTTPPPGTVTKQDGEISAEDISTTINKGMMGQTLKGSSNAIVTGPIGGSAATAPTAPAPAPKKDIETYSVQSGDSIGRIAQQVLSQRMGENGWSSNRSLWGEDGLVRIIERYNGLQPGAYIHPGQKLIIPDVPALGKDDDPTKVMTDWQAELAAPRPPDPRGLSTEQQRQQAIMHIEFVKAEAVGHATDLPRFKDMQGYYAKNRDECLDATTEALAHSADINPLNGGRTPKELEATNQALIKYQTALKNYDPKMHDENSQEAKVLYDAVGELRSVTEVELPQKEGEPPTAELLKA